MESQPHLPVATTSGPGMTRRTTTSLEDSQTHKHTLHTCGGTYTYHHNHTEVLVNVSLRDKLEASPAQLCLVIDWSLLIDCQFANT